MELNWSTLLLEMINFLVLIWILKRFLYKPVLNIISQRQQKIEQQSAEAQRLHDQACALKQQYENRLSDWQQERQQAIDILNQELDTQRAEQLTALQATLADETQKAHSANQLQRSQETQKVEYQAMQQAAAFANHLLKTASGPELQASLLSLTMHELKKLPASHFRAMHNKDSEQGNQIHVQSAYPLSHEQSSQLEETFNDLSGQIWDYDYTQQPELLAGLHISVGAWVLQLNVRDELKGFAEFAHAV